MSMLEDKPGCGSRSVNSVITVAVLGSLVIDICDVSIAWDPSGLLKLRRRVDPTGPQHCCKIGCSPKMCKGDELETFLERHKPECDRIIYVDDGSNDFCPIVRLRRSASVVYPSMKSRSRVSIFR
ncbi:hypothetical protein DENSPDRAFT_657041 [Dentipellis sp. KUC8613]|nr:hypothetical protein DENSPDRAFT_657041 [Dentipellis sp. KUC8613]